MWGPANSPASARDAKDARYCPFGGVEKLGKRETFMGGIGRNRTRHDRPGKEGVWFGRRYWGKSRWGNRAMFWLFRFRFPILARA